MKYRSLRIMERANLNILLVDDHQLFIDGLSGILEKEGLASSLLVANDGKEALEKLRKNEIDLLLLDLSMPGMDGIEVAKISKDRYPETKIIILTMSNETHFVLELLDLKVEGYVLKDVGQEELLRAIRMVVDGNNYFSNEVNIRIQNELRRSRRQREKPEISVTKREREVLKFVVKGYTSKEIAEVLFIAKATVDTHRKNLLSKFKLKNTANLVKFALEKGLVEKEE